ncbi:hypothetical protein [Bacillus sp. UNCCL13]|uniref:hypothetical protein n=1 Tax=Bacillus sp. UNCCL13 TaxID=1502772 RepID=UPI001C315B23|nr:hypothetical protein [Bacillus sp. UNCCL13]
MNYEKALEPAFSCSNNNKVFEKSLEAFRGVKRLPLQPIKFRKSTIHFNFPLFFRNTGRWHRKSSSTKIFMLKYGDFGVIITFKVDMKISHYTLVGFATIFILLFFERNRHFQKCYRLFFYGAQRFQKFIR